MMWTLIAVAAWVVVTFAAVGFARAAGRPWPKQTERFRR